MNIEVSRHIFEKKKKNNLNIKFNQNPSSGRRVVPCEWPDRQTDGHAEANNLPFRVLRKRLKSFLIRIHRAARTHIACACTSLIT
jgi:hypothetical protein